MVYVEQKLLISFHSPINFQQFIYTHNVLYSKLYAFLRQSFSELIYLIEIGLFLLSLSTFHNLIFFLDSFSQFQFNIEQNFVKGE